MPLERGFCFVKKTITKSTCCSIINRLYTLYMTGESYMAQQTSSNGQKRGPGRPPGSKNKPKTATSSSANPTKQEVLEEMQRRSDRDKRNIDVIWSITLFALGLFLFITVVVNSTGSFGKAVHDVCNGLFGVMAYILPFLVFLFAALLLMGKLRHIGTATAIFSLLIYINMCVLNSYRFIDPEELRYGFKDIADYYTYGEDGLMGGAVGMEIGSLLVKFFGKPGLLIIALAILVISVFMVANTPISRIVGKLGQKREENRIIKELEADERRRISESQIQTALASDASVSAAAPEPKKPFWKSVLSGIIRDDSAGEAQTSQPSAGVNTGIPAPFGSNQKTAIPREDVSDHTLIMDSPMKSSGGSSGKGTLFGKLKDFVAGIDSETGKDVTAEELKSTEKPVSAGMDAGRSSSKKVYTEDRHFDSDDVEDYGYPGRKRKPAAVSTGLGLGDPDDVGHSGSFGLDAHGGSAKPASTAVRTAAAATEAAAPSKAKKSTSSSKQASAKTEAESKEDAAIAAGFNTVTDDMSYELPPVSLLKRDTSSKQMMSDMQLQERAELLEQTLKNFGVDAKVIKVTQGASVTRFEVQPAVGVKVSKITGLSDDIALNMRAKSIRIEAPIPGKAAVGIEVENSKPSPVLVRDLIESEEFINARSVIEFVVGKDISGNNVVADLRDMPHLLIAGATGSGKSVCINSIITSFLYKARPSELKLIMIDPKMVELGNYNGIPHMLTPVVTDPRKAARALAIAVDEMEKRYEQFAEHNVKDLNSYNELMRVDQRYADIKPQIVIIIDELADLMMASPSEVETSICRLAQKARAAGLHLIVATQRPSADVVTGLIKANIPSRIAFSVASALDSRIILDMAGAEKLLGKGDMLFSPVGSTKPLRVQGPFISEAEISKIIKFVKKEGGDPEYDMDIVNGMESSDKKGGGEPQDELTEDAIAFIFKSKQASVSMLQRRFRIGYNRAARIIDEIEEMGIIGPSDGSRPRQLLISEDEYYGGGEAEPEPEAEPEQVYEPEPEPVYEPEPINEPEPEPEPVIEAEPEPEPEPVYVPEEEDIPELEMAPEDDGFSTGDKLSNTRAMDSFNSLPESVRRMIMDADSESDY